MYWVAKMHQALTKNAAEKLFSDTAKTQKLILRKFRVLLKNQTFLLITKIFWVVQNAKPVTDMLDQINPKQNANLIPKFSLNYHTITW